MDVVVILALVVLILVFIFALIALFLMCYRRRTAQEVSKTKLMALMKSPSNEMMMGSSASPTPIRYTKMAENNEQIESLPQLCPIITSIFEQNQWMFQVTGVMQHCVALLQLCHQMTDKLSRIPLKTAPPVIVEAIQMTTGNIYPRFDDLLDAVASSSVDFRILEARAMSLATVCWSLQLPYQLMNEEYKNILMEQLNTMNIHLATIRTAAELAAIADRGNDETQILGDLKNHLVKLRNTVRGTSDQPLLESHNEEARHDDEHHDGDDEDDDDDINEPSTSTADDHEMTPLVTSEATIAISSTVNETLPNTTEDGDEDTKLLMNGNGGNFIAMNKLNNGGLQSVVVNMHEEGEEGTTTTCSSSSSTTSEASLMHSSQHVVETKLL